jgi:hypothetical protein
MTVTLEELYKNWDKIFADKRKAEDNQKRKGNK